MISLNQVKKWRTRWNHRSQKWTTKYSSWNNRILSKCYQRGWM